MQMDGRGLSVPEVTLDSSMDNYEKLNQRITTRIMATKLLKQKALENSLYESKKSFRTYGSGTLSLSERSRQPSKFLSGVSIPNSIIKAEAFAVCNNKEIEDKNVLREMRDASVKEIIKRMESRISDLYASPNVSDAENLNKSDGLPEKLNPRESLTNLSASENVGLKLDPVKEQRRVSRRTEYLAPLSCQRKSTYELIKRAIQNSKTSSELIDIDSIEAKCRRNLEVQDSLELRIASLANMSLCKTSSQKHESSQKVTTKSSRTSKKSSTSSHNSKKFKAKRRKSILKRGSREGNKPSRTVSILENKMEDSETQTYLYMKDFLLKVKQDTLVVE